MSSIKDDLADLGGFLKEQRHSAKLSLRQLAEVAGVSNPYLSQIERGLKKPSAEILQSLAKGLRISAESLYVRAGILEEQDGAQVEVKAAILRDAGLSERQKRVLLDIYESFCAENARAEQPARPAPRAATTASPKAPKKAATKAAKKAATKAAPTTRSTTPSTARTTRTSNRRSTS